MSPHLAADVLIFAGSETRHSVDLLVSDCIENLSQARAEGANVALQVHSPPAGASVTRDVSANATDSQSAGRTRRHRGLYRSSRRVETSSSPLVLTCRFTDDRRVHSCTPFAGVIYRISLDPSVPAHIRDRSRLAIPRHVGRPLLQVRARTSPCLELVLPRASNLCCSMRDLGCVAA